MGTIYIDDKAVEFTPGDNVLDAARRAGIEAPYFCYHPALGAAGSCRICAMETVPEKEGERPRTVMTCTIPAAEGQRFKLQSQKAKQIQKGVVEFYMTNHPNDCPVCDEGGDCHLQDTTISVGHAYRRFDGKKRTMPDQYLGPLVYQTMNRCVTCYRCVRFYQHYALGDDFGAMGSSNHVLFRRTDDGAFDSPFSGNLVNVCPTGVFTDKVYRRKYSRTWMLDKADSVCAGCSTGCNINLGGRQGTLRRVHPGKESSAVNPYFICDKGRYGAHGTEAKDRPLCLALNGKRLSDTNIAKRLRKELNYAKGRLGILGSVEEDLMTNLALQQLAAELNASFSPFVSEADENLTKLAVLANHDAPSTKDIEQADMALVIGELTEHAPMLDLSVRQLIKEKRPVAIVHASGSHLVTLSRKRQKGLSLSLAPSQWLTLLTELEQCIKGDQDSNNAWVNQIAASIKAANKLVILSVSSLLTPVLIERLQSLTKACNEASTAQTDTQAIQETGKNRANKARLAIALPSAGSHGAAMLAQADSCAALMAKIDAGQIDTLFVVGSDPLGEHSSRWNQLSAKIKQLIVADKVNTTTAKAAELLLPLAAWPERDGLTINYEGRLQRFSRAYQRQEALLCAEQIIEQMPDERQAIIKDYLSQLTNHLPEAGDQGVVLSADKRCVEISTQVAKAISAQGVERAEAVLCRWFGQGYIADHALALASLKPSVSAYANQTFAKRHNLNTGDQLYIHHGDKRITRPFIIDEQVANNCLALTKACLEELNANLSSPLVVEQAPDLFINLCEHSNDTPPVNQPVGEA